MFIEDLKRFKGANFKDKFIINVYEGLNLVETCAEMRVNPAALAYARRDDIEFDQNIRAAQAFRCDMMTDKLENIKDYESDAHMAKVVSDNIKWLAAKRYREIYGEKLDVNHNHTINIQDAMIEARARTLQFVGDKPLINKDSSTDSLSVAADIIDLEPIVTDPLS